MTTFLSTVAGIPCVVEITDYTIQEPLGPSADSDWDCYGYSEVDFTVCDRRGRAAPWLERKLTDQDKARLKEEALQCIADADSDE